MWDPVVIGRRGGRSKSARKVAAARRNAILGGAKGGRPPKLPPRPEGLFPPQGSTFEQAKQHAHKFIEYYAELAAKKNMMVEHFFTEQEILQTLKRMGRNDLVARWKKRPKPSEAQRRNIAWLLRRIQREYGQQDT